MNDVREFLGGKVVLHCGDCLQVLDTLAENSVDSVVCDPPYHLASIVKRFGAKNAAAPKHGTDGAFGRVDRGFMGKAWDGGDIAFRSETWAKVFRVMKPGAYILAFSSSRTFGRMSVAIEDAGFVTHPMIGWIFAQGFSKAHKVDAEGWDGWRYSGQALKPALEPIYMGQKPFSEKNGTLNVMRWGAGGLNIDGCRVEGENTQCRHRAEMGYHGGNIATEYTTGSTLGRWPANLMHDGSAEVIAGFPSSKGQQGDVRGDEPSSKTTDVYGQFDGRPSTIARNDSGSAARFFWSPKASSDDRLGSKHPTVKPIELIRELVRLETPPGGVVLDLFAGTGTTGEAAYYEGMRAILIEREAEYQDDIGRRMSLILAGPDERTHATIKARGKVADAGPLFGAAEDAGRSTEPFLGTDNRANRNEKVTP